MREIVVVGGGVVGAAAAHRLAAAGAKVAVVDRSEPGQASAAGAGILSPGNRFEHGDPVLPLVRAASSRYRQLVEELEDAGQDTSYAITGALEVALDERRAAELRELVGQLVERREAGFGHIGEVSLLDGDQARAHFPALGDVRVAVHIAGVARVDGRRLRDALLGAAQHHGAEVYHGHARVHIGGGRVVGVMVGDQRLPADVVLVACGAWTRQLLEPGGVDVPVTPQRGQIVHLDLPDSRTGDWPSVFRGSRYFVAFPPNRIAIGATREDGAGYDHRATAAGVHELLDCMRSTAPALGDAALVEVRVGFRPRTPDAVPVLGPAGSLENAYLAVGHGGYGLQVGPESGRMVADSILGRELSVDLAQFSLNRFAKA